MLLRYCLLSLALPAFAFSADTLYLSSRRVAELVLERSAPVLASDYQLQGEEYAVKGAFAGFLPQLSANASYTYLGVLPQISMPSMGSDSTLFRDTTFLRQVMSMDAGDSALIRMVSGGLSSGSSFSLSPQRLYSAGISITQPIFAGGRIFHAYKAAWCMYEAKLHSREQANLEFALSGQQLYWGWVGLMQASAAMAESRKWLEKLIQDQTKMLDAGLIIELDLLKAKTQLSSLKLSEIQLQNQARAMAENLLVFLDLALETPVVADTSELIGPEPMFVPPTPDSIENRILYREDFMASAKQVEALDVMRKIQLGAYLPSLAAFYNYSYTNQYSQKESDLDPTWNIGMGLSWSIFDWGKSYRDAQKTGMQVKSAKKMQEMQKAQLRARIMSLARKVDESREALVIARETVTNAQKALDISQLRYNQQLITTTDLMSDRRALTEAKLSLTQARIQARLALEEYRVAPMGGM